MLNISNMIVVWGLQGGWPVLFGDLERFLAEGKFEPVLQAEQKPSRKVEDVSLCQRDKGS